ncbi:MAG TPA: preprotein translocase subunit YajC [Blastocatellia bacterium]|nr:preprotein translocase subunit YajC [Blastocatellia bacterium]
MSLQFALIWLQAGALIAQFLPIILIFALFYFMIIMPQRRKQQALQNLLNNLKVGDKVITTGGIYGTISIVRDKEPRIQLKIADNPSVKIDVTQSSIAGLQEPPEEKK